MMANRIKLKPKLLLIHIGAWTLLLVVSMLFQRSMPVNFSIAFESSHEFQNLLSWSMLIVYSYVNYAFFVPDFYLKKKYSKYFFFVALALLFICLLPEVTDLIWISPPPEEGYEFGAHESGRSLPPPPRGNQNFQFVLLFGLSTVVSIVTLLKDQLKSIENDRIKSELLNLKSQIQPHFLFNTLNSIYSLALTNHEQTADKVFKLSKFLRYVIQEAEHDRVEIIKEVEYIIDYIDLQKSRYRDILKVDFEYELQNDNLKIAPLLLFSFIENAFHYGINPNAKSRIQIRLESSDKTVFMKVYNKKLNKTRTDGTGIGMTNSQKRMELLYPGKHTLDIKESTEDFEVLLKIELC